MNPILENYQRLSILTGQMRAAATRSEWDKLVELEQQCTREIAALKTRDNVPDMAAERKQKADLIRKMLDDDKAIRALTQPWIHQLERIMQSTRSEQRLHSSYLAL